MARSWLSKPDITGQRFTRLVALQKVESDKSGAIQYLCICDCGTQKKIARADLLAGHIKSCGCLLRETRLKNASAHAAASRGIARLDLRKEPYRWLYTDLLNSAKSRRLEVTLSFEEFQEYTRETECFYCWQSIIWPKPHSDEGGYNLDRKDPKLGYNRDNCVVCCKRCNNGKGNRFTFEEWSKMAATLRPAEMAAHV